MKIVVIDGQGGQLGAGLVKEIIARFPECSLTVIGTNSVATAAMIKAGAKKGATGENPVRVAALSADVIIGPIGIVIADSMLGEITPDMAVAVGKSSAVRILVPMNRCDSLIAGVENQNMASLIDDAMKKLAAIKDSAI